MTAGTAGMQLFGSDGETVIGEVGGHVLTRRPEMAQAVGELAATWAHLEAQLGGYLAALLETTPERTFALLGQFRSARDTSDAAKALANVTLKDSELDAFSELISKFKLLATERNRVQHALWAWKAPDPEALYRVRAVEFSTLMVRVLGADDAAAEAEAFLAEQSDRYDLLRLCKIVEDIRVLLMELTGASIERQRAVLSHPV